MDSKHVVHRDWPTLLRLRFRAETFTPQDVINRWGAHPQSVNVALRALVAKGEVEKLARGVYRMKGEGA